MEAIAELCALVRQEIESVSPVFDPVSQPGIADAAMRQMIAGAEFFKLKSQILTDKNRIMVENVKDGLTGVEAARRDFMNAAREAWNARAPGDVGIVKAPSAEWINEKRGAAHLILTRLLSEIRSIE